MNATDPSPVSPCVSTARDFTRHLADLLRKEHGAMVNFLLALAECDGRRLWADLGYASLFDYLHRELGMSKGAAFYRKSAVALVHRYPQIVDALGDGRLCISSLAEVAKVITPDNASEILPRFFHRSSREAKEVAVEISPVTAPPIRDVVSIVRPKVSVGPSSRMPAANECAVSRCETASVAVQALELHGLVGSTTRHQPEAGRPTEAFDRKPGDEIQPLTATLRRIHVTVSKRWMEKLNAAKDALSHSIPSGSNEEILEAALDALLEREAKRKGLVKTPRKPRPTTGTEPASPKQADGVAPVARGANPSKRHRKAVPAHVRREVLIRDEQRCQAKLHDGTICGSRVRLEFEHVHPDSLGGPTTIENGKIFCRAHNQLAARRVLGEQVMELFGTRPKKGAGNASE